MEHHQTIFVLQAGEIAQWRLEEGKLKLQQSQGLKKSPYSPQFWENWKKANYFSESDDVLDALFLVDDENSFKDFPEWCFGNKGKESGWTLDILSEVVQEQLFESSRVIIDMVGEIPIQGRSRVGRPVLRLFLKPSLRLRLSQLLVVLLDNALLVWEPQRNNNLVDLP